MSLGLVIWRSFASPLLLMLFMSALMQRGEQHESPPPPPTGPAAHGDAAAAAASGPVPSQWAPAELLTYREMTREMFNHAYHSYLRHAYPLDEPQPLSCKGCRPMSLVALS